MTAQSGQVGETEKHTPTPWMLAEVANDRGMMRRLIRPVDDRAHQHGATCEVFGARPGTEAHANAAFIVRAVNTHDDLVAALRACRGFVANEAEMRRASLSPDYIAEATGTLSQIDTALSKAGAL